MRARMQACFARGHPAPLHLHNFATQSTPLQVRANPALGAILGCLANCERGVVVVEGGQTSGCGTGCNARNVRNAFFLNEIQRPLHLDASNELSAHQNHTRAVHEGLWRGGMLGVLWVSNLYLIFETPCGLDSRMQAKGNVPRRLQRAVHAPNPWL